VLPRHLHHTPAPLLPPSDFSEYVNTSNILLKQPTIDKDIYSGVGSEVLGLQTQAYMYHSLFDPNLGRSLACLTQEQDDLGFYDDQEELHEEDHTSPLISDANEDTPNPFVVECNGFDRQ
jgi:hypothetical protein